MKAATVARAAAAAAVALGAYDPLALVQLQEIVMRRGSAACAVFII
jgi:hypothetical protein